MTIFDDVAIKLALMEAQCMIGSELYCDPLYKEGSKSAYASQFSQLRAAIDSYKTDTTGAAQLQDMIMMDFVNQIISEVEYDPPITKISEPYPTGYNDYWECFSMGGLLQDILDYDAGYYYQGCIIAPATTTPNLVGDKARATNAVSADSALRSSLISFLRTPPQYNALIFLTENFTTTGLPKAKTEVGDIVYNDKHAKEIIDTFNFSIYVPTYILNPP
jgi:hypothetical protein